MKRDASTAVETAFVEILAENWDSVVRRSAASVVRRSAAERERRFVERWDRRFAAFNRALLATGAALVAAFPLACAELRTLQDAADAYCLATASDDGVSAPDFDANLIEKI